MALRSFRRTASTRRASSLRPASAAAATEAESFVACNGATPPLRHSRGSRRIPPLTRNKTWVFRWCYCRAWNARAFCLIVASKHVGQRSQPTGLPTPRSRSETSTQLATQFGESHRLDDRLSGSLKSRQEQAFATEQSGLDSACQLHVVGDRFIEGDDTTGVDLEGLTRSQLEFDKIASCVDERDSRAR